MADWLRQPTGDGAGRNQQGETREVTWVAAGLLTPQEALDDPAFPVAFNDPFPDDPASPLRASGIRVNATGFRVQSAVATYSVPEEGDEHRDETPDLATPTVLNWQTVQETVAIDRDVNGNAIVTSARRAVTGVTQSRNYKRVVITAFRDSYNPINALTYENTVNGSSFEGAQTGTVKCTSIVPSTSIESGSTLVPIDHVFDFKPESFWGPDPWQTWARNADEFAFATVDGATVKRRIVTTTGDPAGQVPLDANGIPIESGLTYFALPGDPAPAESPTWASAPSPPGATPFDAGAITFLVYQTAPTSDFNALGL